MHFRLSCIHTQSTHSMGTDICTNSLHFVFTLSSLDVITVCVNHMSKLLNLNSVWYKIYICIYHQNKMNNMCWTVQYTTAIYVILRGFNDRYNNFILIQQDINLNTRTVSRKKIIAFPHKHMFSHATEP
jgi:hypothetical protein